LGIPSSIRPPDLDPDFCHDLRVPSARTARGGGIGNFGHAVFQLPELPVEPSELGDFSPTGHSDFSPMCNERYSKLPFQEHLDLRLFGVEMRCVCVEVGVLELQHQNRQAVRQVPGTGVE